MAKNIPAAEFKAAVKALNVVLKKDGKETIKVVGVKGGKAAVVENFTNVCMDYIDNDKADALPDEAIEIYNTYIAVEEGEEAPAEKEEKPAAKGGAKKGAAKKSAPKKKAPKQPSVVELTVEQFMKHNVRETSKIVKKLEKKFPDRNISSTVSSAMCILKHVEKYID